jgi:hypothetical protein
VKAATDDHKIAAVKIFSTGFIVPPASSMHFLKHPNQLVVEDLRSILQLKYLKAFMFATKVSLTHPECNVDKANQGRDLDERPDHTDKRLTRIQTEDCHGHGNCQLKIVACGGEG